MSIDPALSLLLRTALALLLGWAAVHKLRDTEAFHSALENYQLLPRATLDLLVWLVPTIEIGIALMLLLPSTTRPAALAASILLIAYATAIAVNLASGRRNVDCGCLGRAGRRELSLALVLRNLLLATLAGMAALPVADRACTWLDAVTVIAGVPVLGFLYAAIDVLMANSPALERLRMRAAQS